MSALPPVAIHPGTIIAEHLESSRMTQADLSRRCGVSRKHINYVVRGLDPVSARLAIRLEYVLQRPAIYWLTLQAQYDLTKERERELLMWARPGGRTTGTPSKHRSQKARERG